MRCVSEGPPDHFALRGLPSSRNLNHFVQLRRRHGSVVFGALVYRGKERIVARIDPDMQSEKSPSEGIYVRSSDH